MARQAAARVAAAAVVVLPLLAAASEPLLLEGARGHPLVPGARGAPSQAPLPYWLSTHKQAHVANCVVDVGIAATLLGKAGVSISAAVKECDRVGRDAACTAAVSGVVAGFSYGAAFISAAASECRSSLTIVDEDAVRRAGCAADASVMVATLSVVANAGAVIKDACPGGRMEPGIFEWRRLAAAGANRTEVYRQLEVAARKLGAHGFFHPKAHKKAHKFGFRTDQQNAACAFDVGQFTFLSARAGLMINYAVEDCSAYHLWEGGDLTKAKCVADLGRAIGAFGYTASGIAAAVFDCPDVMDNFDAACAGAIINLVAATAELVGNGAGLATTCHVIARRERAAGQATEDADGTPLRRRLSPTAVAVPTGSPSPARSPSPSPFPYLV